jgi:DNA-binding transcriptional LysR family regulator
MTKSIPPLRYPSLKHLRLIVAVADQGNLISAAAALNLSQPAVTKSLQDAEAIIGERIFERTSRGVELTIYGEALIVHARHILTQLDNAVEEIADIKGGRTGRVVIGTLISASVEIIPRAILKARAERPDIVVRVEEGPNDILVPRLRAGEIDFVVGRLSEFRQRDGLEQEQLFNDRACIVARPGHPLKRTMQLSRLIDANWILPLFGTTLRRQVEASFRKVGLVPPSRHVESVSNLTNQLLIDEGDYVAVWPQAQADREAKAGRIVILPTPMPETACPFGITTRANARLTPVAMAMISLIRSLAGDNCREKM